jgi:hypothetical protein
MKEKTKENTKENKRKTKGRKEDERSAERRVYCVEDAGLGIVIVGGGILDVISFISSLVMLVELFLLNFALVSEYLLSFRVKIREKNKE